MIEIFSDFSKQSEILTMIAAEYGADNHSLLWSFVMLVGIESEF